MASVACVTAGSTGQPESAERLRRARRRPWRAALFALLFGAGPVLAQPGAAGVPGDADVGAGGAAAGGATAGGAEAAPTEVTPPPAAPIEATPQPAAPSEAAGGAGSSERAPPPVVTPPRPIDIPVTYPSGAEGSASVLLDLVVDRDGAVKSAQVIEGEEPFATAAVEAAARWRFEPARRDGQAVAARIRFVLGYRLSEPIPALPPDATQPPPTVPAPSVAPDVQVTEVQVLGNSTPGALALSQGEVRVMAGAMGDPFRAVASLPGVGQLVTGLPVFFVRGAPPGNLGFYVDNVRVPLLFHAFLGPGVIHPRMIERIELLAGGYPASYGRFAGGVVSAELAQPKGELNVEWSARLVDAGVFVDAPFAGGRGNVMLAGRYSYTALVLSLLSDVTLDYWDYQALAQYDLTPRDRLSVFAFGAYDYAATPTSTAEGEVPEDGENAVLFHRIDLRYDRRFGDTTKLRAAVTLGTEGTRGGQGLVRDRLAGFRLELKSQLSEAVLLRAGASGSFDRYELELDPLTVNFTDVTRLFPTRTDSVIGANADLVIQAAPGVSVTPGVRVDRYASAGRTAASVSPRLSASFRLTPAVSVEHVFGIADQPPNFVPGIPGVAVAGLPGGLQRAVQTSAGVRAELPGSFTSTTTLFQHAYFQLSDPFGQTQDLDLDVDEAEIRSTGRAVGLELSLMRPITRGVGASFAYTLSRTTRSYGRVNTLAGYDRPHVVNIGGSLDLGKHWLASARAVMYSGVPGSRAFGDRRLFDRDRARPFFRMDLRLEKRFVLSSGAWWAVVAELMNATLSTEVVRRPCEPNCTDETVGPIVLPSLGVMGQL